MRLPRSAETYPLGAHRALCEKSAVRRSHCMSGPAVDEVRWSDRFNKINHNPHFPYLVTHFTDATLISSFGGALSGRWVSGAFPGRTLQ